MWSHFCNQIITLPIVGENWNYNLDSYFLFSPYGKYKLYKILKNKEQAYLEIEEVKDSPLNSPHKNPNQYNGQVLDIQDVDSKNIGNKKLYIESLGCH